MCTSPTTSSILQVNKWKKQESACSVILGLSCVPSQGLVYCATISHWLVYLRDTLFLTARMWRTMTFTTRLQAHADRDSSVPFFGPDLLLRFIGVARFFPLDPISTVKAKSCLFLSALQLWYPCYAHRRVPSCPTNHFLFGSKRPECVRQCVYVCITLSTQTAMIR